MKLVAAREERKMCQVGLHLVKGGNKSAPRELGSPLRHPPPIGNLI